jgi:hypothetical protein
MEEKPEGAFGLLALGMNLSTEQQGLIIRVMWVVVVSSLFAWILGAGAIIGLPSKFALAADVSDLKQQQVTLETNVRISARISLSRELRDEMALRCRTTDPAVYNALSNYIEQLQQEYVSLTGARYPDTVCR